MKQAGIYKITSPSGKVYIGQSWDISERFSNYRRRECKQQRALLFSFQKHSVGAHSFEVIHRLARDTAQPEMDRLEQFYMDDYRAQGIILLNCREAGSRGKLSEETKARVSASLIGKTPWNKGRRDLPKHSDEWKAQMSARLKGQKPNNYGKPRSRSAVEATRRGNLGLKRSKAQVEHLKHIWATRPPNMGGRKNRGRVHTAEHREKLRQARNTSGAGKGERHPMAKVSTATVREIRAKYIPRKYPSRRLAREYGLSKTNILDIVNRRIWPNA